MDNVRIPRILVVDDDKNQRYMLELALQNCGYKVVAVAGGAEALEQAASGKFDAVICDIMMPGMNGVETLRALKAAQPGLKVVMATGYATAQTAAQSMRLGAINYLAKPYQMSDLLEVLSKALGDKPDAGDREP